VAKPPIKILVVDDSAVVRQALTEIFDAEPDLSVIATAADPYIAALRMKEERPDVITLDVEMPRMDGLTFLQKLMSQFPIPVVMCSSLTEQGCETALRALEYGAVDIITKPRIGVKQFLEESRILICDTVRAAAQARLGRRPTLLHVEEKLSADVIVPDAVARPLIATTEKVVVIGASTGGTEALCALLGALPPDAPGIVVVQHMPEQFTASFAQRLDRQCRVRVKEAADDDGVVRGRVLIAPGNRHALLKRSGARYFVELRDGPLVTRHRPSVDVLFRTAARYAQKNAVGVILTGMGDDGAQGMLEMHESGAVTIAQDEASCVVYGMPGSAVRLGGVDRILPLDRIPAAIMQFAG
jgi:two-component system, chemotaxis family, protein-glutamate methylesterase/glutaminase